MQSDQLTSILDEEKTVLMDESEETAPSLVMYCRGKVAIFPLNGEQSFGRTSSSGTPDIHTDSKTVSRRHGRFDTYGGSGRYVDLGSTNGTMLNGSSMAPASAAILSDGDVLRVHGPKDASCSQDCLLVYTKHCRSAAEWQSVRLNDEMAEISIGRGEALSIRDRHVSRKHATFFNSSRGWTIIDNGSLNGVILNGRRITQPEYLRPMDTVIIGGYIFFFTGKDLVFQMKKQEDISYADYTSEAVSAGTGGSKDVLSVRIHERNVWKRMQKRTLLRDINLDIESGSLVLVLGGSGAGKTTFMNAVMGFEPAEGSITYNDTDIYAEYEKMKYEIGYVPQQDLLRLNDTVYDTLRNAASMRMPRGLDPSEYEKSIERTIAVLGLSRVRDSLVRKLSGGQRKRLSIAVEYIGDPSLFFLDEPDSGLDGTMARALMENLRTIADDGKIAIVISHSPDRAFELWDKVIVLAKDTQEDTGRLAFYGSPEEACAFFETKTLEQIVRRINRPDEGGEGLADHFIEKFERGKV